MNWISVNDKLPEELRLLLICYNIDMFGNNSQLTEMSMYKNNIFNRATYYEDKFIYICKENEEEQEFKNVTHWMYWSDIPRPYNNI